MSHSNKTFDCLSFRFTENTLYFKGTSVDTCKQFEVTLNFLHKINPENVTTKNTSRCIEFSIKKAESGPFWASLTNDKKKPHFLKADFNKWRDEESDIEEGRQYKSLSTYIFDGNNTFVINFWLLEEGGDAGGFGNMQEMFANLNSGAATKPNFDDFDADDKEDSDDEEIPNLE